MKPTLDAQRIAISSLVADHGNHIAALQLSLRFELADLPTSGNEAAALNPLPSSSTLIAQSTV